MLNFVRFAQDHNLPYTSSGHHHCSTGWVQTHCPFCAGGHEGYHLGFNLSGGYFNCWRCSRLKHVDVIRALARVSEEQAKRILRKYNDGKKGHKEAPKVRKRKLKTPFDTGPLEFVHRKYLRSRGFPRSIITEWELKGTRHLSDLWNWRIVFPIKTENDLTVAWCGRSIHKTVKPKYRMTDDVDCLDDPQNFLYGMHKVPGDSVIIVEGPADVWRMGPGACATLGIDWHSPQANQLRRFQNRFIMFDPGKESQRRAADLADWLSYYPGQTEIISGLPCDPGDLPTKMVKKIRQELLGVE